MKGRFRPLSGIMFSIKGVVYEMAFADYKFPSPLGDYVFNLKCKTRNISDEFVSVPSRGLCFQSGELRGVYRYRQGVSVPSRGLCFQSKKLGFKWASKKSFRPLSGIMFSIFHYTAPVYSVLKFPSPLGDYVFNRYQ